MSQDFDIHQDHPRSVTSPQLLQDTQGCQFRMTSYNVETGGPDFEPAYGVQLHDPCLLEYVGAPESAWLTSLQHDAGLILSNVQVLQQLVTALSRISSDMLGAVHGGQPFPANAMQQVMPSYRIRWRWVCGVRQSTRRYKDPCRRRRAMPARPVVIASRRCLCEPGGEVELYDSDCY